MMNISGNRMTALLKKLNFNRLSTTEGEKKAAEIIKGELASFGVDSVIEPFKAPKYSIITAKFEVLEPKYKEYTVSGYGFSGNNAENGLEAEFKYVENAEDIDLLGVKGKIVMLGGVGYETYERLCKAGVAGFVSFSGNFFDEKSKTDLDERMLRSLHIKNGQIPGVCMRVSDAIELVRGEASKVRLTLRQEEGEGDSQNVVAEIKGTEHPEEVIVYTAHYDSVVFSNGMFDNGSGTVMLAEILRYFKDNPPKRTVRFIWCGSEERGLLGSKAYIAAHEDILEKIIFCVNIDMAGTVLGRDCAIVTAEEKLCNMIEYMYKEIGYPMGVRNDIYSSDSIPFADRSIPGVNIVRNAAPGAGTCHNRHDVLVQLDGKSLKRTTEFTIELSKRLVNAYMFPVSRKLPDAIVDKLNKYLRKEPNKK